MPENVPPGRAGRLWLRARLESARRSMELLDRKRQLLRRERDRLAERREATAREWARTCTAADGWGLRAALLGGATEVILVGARLAGAARTDITWRNTMGVRHPDEAHCELPVLSPSEAAAANAAVAPAATAYRLALQAAADHAIAQRAWEAVEAELLATEHRHRAIERRRLPALAGALQRLELRLDELERQERVVARWAHQRARAR